MTTPAYHAGEYANDTAASAAGESLAVQLAAAQRAAAQQSTEARAA